TFFQQFRADAVGSSFSTVLVNGGLDNQNEPGVEVCVQSGPGFDDFIMDPLRLILISNTRLVSRSRRPTFTTGESF
ncbi:hypothetical protein C0992_001302, partial [Termitomyces sp. T32_za158]